MMLSLFAELIDITVPDIAGQYPEAYLRHNTDILYEREHVWFSKLYARIKQIV